MRRAIPWSLLLTACTETVSGAPTCTVDADCDDGNPCTGAETCADDGTCAPGDAVTCADPEETCFVLDDAAVCDVLCVLPRAPVLSVIAEDEVLAFTGPPRIETAVVEPDRDPAEADWLEGATVSLTDRRGPTRVLARGPDSACDQVFDHVYDVRDAYPGPAGTSTSEGVPFDDARLVGWAAAVHDHVQGEDVISPWDDPTNALGPVTEARNE
ncbi:MAG: hypothetical protein KC656_30215, partial [Myxococcales bacterium]|nr:hypothetical protein [Myxococcales bacterium]